VKIRAVIREYVPAGQPVTEERLDEFNRKLEELE
jgi:hypothetical protein